jgi:hypothetical protein
VADLEAVWGDGFGGDVGVVEGFVMAVAGVFCDGGSF